MNFRAWMFLMKAIIMGSFSQRAQMISQRGAKVGEASAKRQIMYQKSFRSNLPSKHSPDSSGSPLLGVGNGDAAATADSGTGHDTRRNHRLLIEIIIEMWKGRLFG